MSKTERERLEIRSQVARELASNGFSNVSVLSKERLLTVAHPRRLEILSALEDRKQSVKELSELLNVGLHDALHHAEELATLPGITIEEESEITVVELTADYIVFEPLAAVPDVDVPEGPDEPEVPVVGDTNE